ncbi:hypothetical protein EG834_02415, partial [bacterium]|nr:hypothetical protein [bacterium]
MQSPTQISYAGPVYYMDCSAAENGDGSQESPWNTVKTPNQKTFHSGDSLLLKRDTACPGMLQPQGSGTADAPITLGAYGTGALPIIDGDGADPAAIQLINQQGWHIENIEAIGGSTYGIYIGNKGKTTLTHFRITNVVVHDVPGNSTDKLDGLIYIATDWFKDGIIQDVIVDGATAYNTGHWNGIKIMCTGKMTYPETLPVIIRNSTVHTTGGEGIVIFSSSHGLVEQKVAWGTGHGKKKTAGNPNRNWTGFRRDCINQVNEVYLAYPTAGEGGAFDIDYPAENNTVQYNYGHDNDSYCVAVLGAANSSTINSTVRYNICANNNQEIDSPDGSSSRFGEFDLFTWDDGWLDGVAIYNNTVYWNPWDGAAWPAFCNGCIDGWPVTFKGTRPNFFMNNIIYSTSPNLVFSLASGNMKLDNNLYWYTGTEKPMFAYGGETYAEVIRYTSFAAYQAGSGQDTHSLFIDPLLTDPTSHTDGMPTTAFTLLPGSPAIDAGADLAALGLVPDMGTRDFFGNPIPIGAYDIGAYESPLSSSAIPQIAGARAVGQAAYNAARGGEPPSNLTCRSVQRVTASGSAIRIRLSNATGSDPLSLDQVFVGISAGGAATVSNIQAFFGGLPGVTIPVGGQVYSDPLALPVSAGDDVAVSFYMAGKAPDKWAAGWPEEISYSSYCTDWVDGGNYAAEPDG